MVEADEQELLRRARAGDIDAFGELFERARSLLRAKLRQIVRNSDDVEELLQDAFLKSWSAIRDFHGASRISSWLYKVTANLGWDHVRKESSRRHVPLEGPFVNEQVSSRQEDAESGTTNTIERFSSFGADQNEDDPEHRYEECEEILGKALEGLTAQEQEVIKQICFRHRRNKAKQVAASMGFRDHRKVYEIRRKFIKLCLKAREELHRSCKAAPPVDGTP